MGPLQLMQGEIVYFTASQGWHNISSLAIQLLSEGRTRQSWRERLETHVPNQNLDLQDVEIIDSQVVIDEARSNGLHSFHAWSFEVPRGVDFLDWPLLKHNLVDQVNRFFSGELPFPDGTFLTASIECATFLAE